MKFKRIKKLHFVGIGGVGMSGIAEILFNSGYEISGSDLRKNDASEFLKSIGIEINYGHSESNINGSDVVIISSAVGEANVEVKEARRQKITVISRAEMLAELMRMKISIAVAGTHGKTTTTSMIGHLLKEGSLDPTVIVGGRVIGVGSNSYLGKSDYLIAEADEFDRSITRFYPTISVITSLEPEHMECYEDFNDLENCFIEFANRVPFYGSAILCIDEEGVRNIESRITRPIITYGLSSDAQFRAANIDYFDGGIKFTLYHNQKRVTDVQTNVQGEHNLKNMLAAFAVAYDLEVPLESIVPAANTFHGVSRRMELAGEVNGIRFYDDYGHHPTEIQTTIKGLRTVFDGRIIAVFQPHLYSRTQRFYEDFGESFNDADKAVILDVFPAREKPIDGISGKLIVDVAVKSGHKGVEYIEDKEKLPNYLSSIVEPGDRVILFGAGDINRYTKKIIELMKDKS